MEAVKAVAEYHYNTRDYRGYKRIVHPSYLEDGRGSVFMIERTRALLFVDHEGGERGFPFVLNRASPSPDEGVDLCQALGRLHTLESFLAFGFARVDEFPELAGV